MKKLIILILVCVVLYFIFFTGLTKEDVMDFKIDKGDYTVQDVKFSDVTGKFEDVDLGEVKSRISNTDIFDKIPKDSVIAVEFFDGAGNLINKGVTIYGDGRIKEFIDDKNDFKVETGTYYIDDVRSGEICDLFRSIKNSKDYRIVTDKSKLSLMWKYRGLMKDCLL